MPERTLVLVKPDGVRRALVGEILGWRRVNLYMDHVLHREAGAAAPTPWHHDTPYCFVGTGITSMPSMVFRSVSMIRTLPPMIAATSV